MIPEWLSLIDLTVLAAVLLFAFGGLHKGFAGQIAHILTFLITGLILFFAYPFIYTELTDLFYRLNERALMWIILIGLVILTMGIFLLISVLLSKIIKSKIPHRADQFFGLILGAIRGMLLALLVMIFFILLGPSSFHQRFQEKSKTGTFVCKKMIPTIQPHIPSSAMDRVDNIKQRLMEQEEAGNIDL